jgi:hypothetical protein
MNEKIISNSTVLHNTAVLFLVFNRLDATKKVFKEINKARPPRIYVASDGARVNKKREAEKVKVVRDFIISNITWECEVKTLFRETNLGCKVAVSEAIDWFFESEEMGIILEDDCLPSLSFFLFCEDMLERYKNDMRIWHIAGNNFQFGWQRDPDYSYYFSYYGSIWGWATWSNRWEHYDVNIKSYNEIKSKNYLQDLFGNKKEANFRCLNFDMIQKGFDTWDYQWAYTRLINSGLSIVPSINLVSNLGFGENATHTHTKDDDRANMEIFDLDFPLTVPAFVIRDKVSDDRFFNKYVYNYKHILRTIIKKVLRK